MRVLQSFPHKIGADRICTTAWHQAVGVAGAGGDVRVHPGAVHRALPTGITVRPTLARGRFRAPYRALGDRAFAIHDTVVAKRLTRALDKGEQVDVVHAWPLAASKTLRAARSLGVPTVLERPNAHTRYAYETVSLECKRLGVELPPDHEHAYNAARLAKEEEEYALTDYLLCPSEFVVQTFVDRGFPRSALLRHVYGYDETRFYPEDREANACSGLNALFVGVCAVRKGVHFALEAWLRSPASKHGTLRIAGGFVADYQRTLEPLLAHPSVEVLGHRTDVPELMRRADVFLLPSLEEGFPLACVEAMGSGCVPLVSAACTGAADHGRNGFVHAVGDVHALEQHITELDEDRDKLAAFRRMSLGTATGLTWAAAGERLLDAYTAVMSASDSYDFAASYAS